MYVYSYIQAEVRTGEKKVDFHRDGGERRELFRDLMHEYKALNKLLRSDDGDYIKCERDSRVENNIFLLKYHHNHATFFLR